MLELLGVQSARQYKALGRQIAAHIETGEIVNHSTEKVSAFERKDPSLTRSVSTESVKKEDETTEREIIQVGWEGPIDPLNPRQWSLTWRSTIFAILWINVFAVDWASSCDSQVHDSIQAAFGVSKTVESLSPSLYTFGMSFDI